MHFSLEWNTSNIHGKLHGCIPAELFSLLFHVTSGKGPILLCFCPMAGRIPVDLNPLPESNLTPFFAYAILHTVDRPRGAIPVLLSISYR